MAHFYILLETQLVQSPFLVELCFLFYFYLARIWQRVPMYPLTDGVFGVCLRAHLTLVTSWQRFRADRCVWVRVTHIFFFIISIFEIKATCVLEHKYHAQRLNIYCHVLTARPVGNAFISKLFWKEPRLTLGSSTDFCWLLLHSYKSFNNKCRAFPQNTRPSPVWYKVMLHFEYSPALPLQFCSANSCQVCPGAEWKKCYIFHF